MQKTNYRVAPGVAQINGRQVPDTGVMLLSRAEAMFDLAHGRISPEPTEVELALPRESDIAPAPVEVAKPVTRRRPKVRTS